MTKVMGIQVKQAKAAMAEGKPLPKRIRVNFGDPEPIQRMADVDKPTEQTPAVKEDE